MMFSCYSYEVTLMFPRFKFQRKNSRCSIFLHFILLNRILFLFKDVEKKMELKSPKTLHPWETQHVPNHPNQKCGNLDTSSPNLTQPCALGRGLGVIALATCEQSAPIVPIAQLLHVELAHNLQSPGIPSHTQVREPQSAPRCQGQPLV